MSRNNNGTGWMTRCLSSLPVESILNCPRILSKYVITGTPSEKMCSLSWRPISVKFICISCWAMNWSSAYTIEPVEGPTLNWPWLSKVLRKSMNRLFCSSAGLSSWTLIELGRVLSPVLLKSKMRSLKRTLLASVCPYRSAYTKSPKLIAICSFKFLFYFVSSISLST